MDPYSTTTLLQEMTCPEPKQENKERIVRTK